MSGGSFDYLCWVDGEDLAAGRRDEDLASIRSYLAKRSPGEETLLDSTRIRSAARRAEERRGTTTATAAARVLLVLRRRVVLLRAERRELSRQWARAERMRDLLARAGL